MDWMTYGALGLLLVLVVSGTITGQRELNEHRRRFDTLMKLLEDSEQTAQALETVNRKPSEEEIETAVSDLKKMLNE